MKKTSNKYKTSFNENLINLTNKRYLIIASIIVVFGLFICIQLFNIQVIEYKRNVELAYSSSDSTKTKPADRGEFIDFKQEVIVSNQESLSFIYLRPQDESEETRIEKATYFVDLFDVNLSRITHRDKQDYYLLFHDDEINQIIDSTGLSDSEFYQKKLDYLTPEFINNNLTEREIKIANLVFKMRESRSLDIILKDNVTVEEVNILLEHTDKLSGIEPYINSNRVTTKEHHLGSIFGGITDKSQGLFKESSTYNLALGYSLNSQIGANGLEAYYEPLLKGDPKLYDLSFSNNGLVSVEEITQGKKGDILQLTINSEFQKDVENIVENFIKNSQNEGYQKYFNSLFIVASNPNTGGILANVGIQFDKEENTTSYIPSATYLNSYIVGSAVKGAMVYLFLDKGIFKPGEVVLDEPLKIQGSSQKSSFVDLGNITDLEALSRSSNVYMFKGIIELGEGEYEYDRPLYLKPGTLSMLKSNYSQFGLGTPTGLDVPYEEIGFQSTSNLPGHLLDYGIGQFDTYTPMQLNQYVSTIANGKYRYKNHFVSHSYDSVTNQINYQHHPEILNVLMNPMAIKRVQEGFRLCVTDGYCNRLNGLSYPVAAKTGTAEAGEFIDGEFVSLSNYTSVSYGPYENPKIAISCVAPKYTFDVVMENPCMIVVEQIFETYFNKYLND